MFRSKKPVETPSGEAPAEPLAEEERSPSSRAKLVAAGGVGLLAVGLLSWFVVLPALHGDDDDETGPVAAARPPAAAPKAAPSATPSPAATPAVVPAAVTGTAQRDPFKALVVPTVAPASPTAGTDTQAPADTSTDPTATRSPTATQSPAAAGTVLTLTKVDATTVSVTVNDSPFTVAVGDTFAEKFKLSQIEAPEGCAGFLYGEAYLGLCQGGAVTLP